MNGASALEDATEFWIPTPMTEALRERLEQWLHCGHTGGVIVGEARLGKTRAIGSIQKTLANRAGQPINAFYTHYGQRDTETIRAVYAKLARAMGFDVKRQTADVLLDMIVVRLAEAALSNDTRQVVLLVDEAQLLSPKQLNAFAEIYNELVSMRINCVIFFIANQDQFEFLGRALLKRENRYVRERFFHNLDYFHGIRTEAELGSCLDGYDHYGVGDSQGQVATEYFCPKLYSQGWRLSKIAELYWRHYRDYYGIPLEQTSFGMSQFVRATNLLLMDYLPLCDDAEDSTMLEACVVKSLAAAGITPSLTQLVGVREF